MRNHTNVSVALRCGRTNPIFSHDSRACSCGNPLQVSRRNRALPSLSLALRALSSSSAGLKRETLQSSVNYIDRYLSLTPAVAKTRLQLVGVTALFVAAKLEEIYPPRMQDFALTTDGAFSVEQLDAMEKDLLRCLDWRICPITYFCWVSMLVSELGKELAALKSSDDAPANAAAGAASVCNPNAAGSGTPQQHRKQLGSWAAAGAASSESQKPATQQTQQAQRTKYNFAGVADKAGWGEATCLLEPALDLIDICILELSTIQFLPSEVASAALVNAAQQAGPAKARQLLPLLRKVLGPIAETVGFKHCFDFQQRWALTASTAQVKREPHVRIQKHVGRSHWCTLQQYNPEACGCFGKHAHVAVALHCGRTNPVFSHGSRP